MAPFQSWRTFVLNHAKHLVSVEFLLVSTATFRSLSVFAALAHERRRIVHFNLAAHPLARWTGQLMNKAFPYDSAPRYVIRDRDQKVRRAK